MDLPRQLQVNWRCCCCWGWGGAQQLPEVMTWPDFEDWTNEDLQSRGIVYKARLAGLKPHAHLENHAQLIDTHLLGNWSHLSVMQLSPLTFAWPSIFLELLTLMVFFHFFIKTAYLTAPKVSTVLCELARMGSYAPCWRYSDVTVKKWES